MVRYDSCIGCRPRMRTGRRENPDGKREQITERERERGLTFARTHTTYQGPQFVIILRHFYKLRSQEKSDHIHTVNDRQHVVSHQSSAIRIISLVIRSRLQPQRIHIIKLHKRWLRLSPL